MAINVIAGSKLYISSTTVAYKDKLTAADFSAITWVEIGPLTQLSGFGIEMGVASQEVINTRVTQYKKSVASFPMSENAVLPDRSQAGQIAFEAAAANDCDPYAFKIEWSTDCERTSVVTVTIATPGVFTWTAHGLVANTPIVFSTTGALPTGITAGVTYYVSATGLTANSFSVSATPGGAAITTSGTQSGVHTAVAQPIGETEMVYGFAMPASRAGGAASDVQTKPINIQPIAKSVKV